MYGTSITPALVKDFCGAFGVDIIIDLIKSDQLSIHATDPTYQHGLMIFAVTSIENETQFLKFLDFFVKNGGNVNHRNQLGKTALDFCPDSDARERIHWKVTALRTHNAKYGAELGSMPKPTRPLILPSDYDSIPEMARLRMEQEKLSAKRLALAQAQLKSEAGLAEYVKKHLMPNLLYLKTANGIHGMGFFQHQEWMVSNAHVFPSPELIKDTIFYGFDGKPFPIAIQASYHRKPDNDAAPDLIIINAKTGREGVSGILPFFTEDEHSDVMYFYLHFDKAKSSYEIRRIYKISKEGTSPDIYLCAHGKEPIPGESGSPIFAARVNVIGERLEWQAIVVGALYARCSPAWYNSNPEIKTVHISEKQKLICAIPVEYDFSQIRTGILIPRDTADRADSMTEAAESLGISSRHHSKLALIEKAKLAAGIEAYKAGITPLNIALPAGLEKLWYKGFVKLEQSLLIRDVFDSEVLDPGNKLAAIVPTVSLEDLQNEYAEILAALEAKAEIKLVAKNNFLSGEYLRIDIGGGKEHWFAQLQDNTGVYKGKPKKGDAQPLSSVFASIQIPKTLSSIAGKDFAKLIRLSYETGSSKVYPIDLAAESKKSVPDKTAVKKPTNTYKSSLPFGEAATDPDKVFAAMLMAKFNIGVNSVPKDGHCQFRAIAEELQRNGKNTKHDILTFTHMLRKSTSQLMRNDEAKEKLISFFNSTECHDCVSYEDFVTQMETVKDAVKPTEAYGNDLTLNALGAILKTKDLMPIIVLHPDDFKPGKDILWPHRVYGCELKDLDLSQALYLVYDGGNHYDALYNVTDDFLSFMQTSLNKQLGIETPSP